MLISVVIPTYNEAECVQPVYEALVGHIRKDPNQWEIIFVNDGSHDATYDRIASLCQRDDRIKCLCFSRNFGHQNALLAGIEHAKGDAVIMMDGDMQHPPELILPLVQAWQEGFDIVQAVRKDSRMLGWFKRSTSLLFYRFFSYLSGMRITPKAADFRLVSRQVVEEIRRFSEHEFFLRGLISWLGFKTKEIAYEPGQRHAGKTKYTLRQMLRLASDATLAFSIKPIRLCILTGFTTFMAALVYLGHVLYVKFVTQEAIPGWTSIIILIVFLQGIQFILMGIQGEYIGRVYFESKRRPRYVIQSKMNF